MLYPIYTSPWLLVLYDQWTPQIARLPPFRTQARIADAERAAANAVEEPQKLLDLAEPRRKPEKSECFGVFGSEVC